MADRPDQRDRDRGAVGTPTPRSARLASYRPRPDRDASRPEDAARPQDAGFAPNAGRPSTGRASAGRQPAPSARPMRQHPDRQRSDRHNPTRPTGRNERDRRPDRRGQTSLPGSPTGRTRAPRNGNGPSPARFGGLPRNRTPRSSGLNGIRDIRPAGPHAAGDLVRGPVLAVKAIACALAILLIGGITIALPAGIEPDTEVKLLDMKELDSTRLTVSTPRRLWISGLMPYLYQTDPLWESQPYAGGTVRANGCGPTALTMVYVYLTGDTSIDPADMCAIADAGNYAPTGATEWAFMTQGAASLGITGRSINATRSAITAALEAGRPVICSMKPGDFTTIGHYVVLSAIDERGMVTVHDPNSVLNSMQRWGIQRLLTQINACWSYTA